MFFILPLQADIGIGSRCITILVKRLLIIGSIFLSLPVMAQLNADFTLSKDKGCSPLLVNFTNTSSGSPDSCFWSLGINGNTSDNCNPSAIYNIPGVYQVTLTVFKGNLRSSKTKTVTVFHDPVAQFNVSPATGCIPFSVQFQNMSTSGDAPITSVLWDMGDGRTNSSQNPNYTYTAGGSLTVSLIITDANGCKNTITKPNIIKANIPPVVDFTIATNESCRLPFTTNFTSVVTPNTNITYAWNFGNGLTSSTANPTATYVGGGNFPVSLTVTDENSCHTTKTISDAVRVNPFKINVDLQATICENTTMHPTVNTTFQNVHYFWNFGNGTNSEEQSPEIIYHTPGNYTLTCLAVTDDGCRDSVRLPVHVVENAEADFTSSLTFSCSPFTLSLVNQSTNAVNYQWSIWGPGGFFTSSTVANPSIFLPSIGLYTIELRAYSANGCISYIKKEDFAGVRPNTLSPHADKKYGCKPLTVEFSANPNVSASSYLWDFGDGTTGTGERVQHTYIQEGDYLAKVTAVYPPPCVTVTVPVDSIHVGFRTPFSGDFDLTSVCVHKETVTYQAHGGTPNTIFTWMFGDGEGQGAMATHVYQDPSDPDKYTVYLVAQNGGCRDTIPIKQIFVAYPKADFTINTVCGSNTVTLNNTSRGFTTAIWSFGDGTTLTTNDPSVTHTYASNQQVLVKLKVYNATTGCWDSIGRLIDFVSDINLNYTSENTSGCKPLIAHFLAPYDTMIQTYTWDFGNGIRGYGRNIYGIFPNEGTYYVTLEMKLKNGCTVRSTRIDTVQVYDVHPNFTMQHSGNCLPANYTFKDSSIANSSGIKSIKWLIDSTINLSGNQVNYTFTTSGIHTVKIIVENNNGCVRSLTKTITIDAPYVDFSADKDFVCAGTTIHFTNLSSGKIQSYLWDFGDGTTSSDASPDHHFSQERNYTIILTVTDSSGCTVSISKNQYVHIKNLHVDFTASPRFKSCPDLISNFQVLNNTPTTYQSISWDFGNGNSSNNLNTTPQAVYTRADSFDIRLIVTDVNNCTDTVFKKDYIIVSGPSGEFTFTPDSGCLPLNVGFNASFKNTTTTIWDFGNGDTRTDNTASNRLNYNYTREGDYTPAVVLKDNFGCTVNVVSTHKVRVGRLSAQFNLNKNSLCLGSDQVVLSDSVYTSQNTAITQKYWTVNDGVTIDTGVGNTYLPTSNRPLEFKFKVANTFGCEQSITKNLQVYEYPITVATEDKIICKGENIPLQVQTNATHITWTPSTGLSNSNSVTVTASPSTNTDYIIKTYQNALCPIYDTVSILVKTALNAQAFPDTVICYGDSVQLHGIADNTSLYQTKVFWTPASTLTSQTDFNPIAFPKHATTYLATFTNGTCAAKQIPVFVDVKPLPTVTAGEEQIIIKGMSIDLTSVSSNATSYSWFPDYNIACTNCQNTQAKPEVDTTYFVEVKNQYGCKVLANQKIKVIEDCAGNMVFLPNTFTPNGDGQNDLLHVMGPGISSVKVFRIFNRWGELVFETRDMNEGWNGTYKGEKLNPGVFVYYLEVECIDFRTTMKKGDITLLR